MPSSFSRKGDAAISLPLLTRQNRHWPPFFATAYLETGDRHLRVVSVSISSHTASSKHGKGIGGMRSRNRRRRSKRNGKHSKRTLNFRRCSEILINYLASRMSVESTSTCPTVSYKLSGQQSHFWDSGIRVPPFPLPPWPVFS